MYSISRTALVLALLVASASVDAGNKTNRYRTVKVTPGMDFTNAAVELYNRVRNPGSNKTIRVKTMARVPGLPNRVTLRAETGQTVDQIARPGQKASMNRLTGWLQRNTRAAWVGPEGTATIRNMSADTGVGRHGYFGLSMKVLNDKRRIDTIVNYQVDQLQFNSQRRVDRTQALRLVAKSIKRQKAEINPAKKTYWLKKAARLEKMAKQLDQ